MGGEGEGGRGEGDGGGEKMEKMASKCSAF